MWKSSSRTYSLGSSEGTSKPNPPRTRNTIIITWGSWEVLHRVEPPSGRDRVRRRTPGRLPLPAGRDLQGSLPEGRPPEDHGRERGPGTGGGPARSPLPPRSNGRG